MRPGVAQRDGGARRQRTPSCWYATLALAMTIRLPVPPVNEALSPERALIFRITHRANVPWLLRYGVHCRRSPAADGAFVPIGNQSVIDWRETREVDHRLGGTLADYVPFYFTPFSPMLLNIVTGYNVRQRQKSELVVLVSSLLTLEKLGVAFLFTDRNAYFPWARYSNQLGDLEEFVPWDLLRARDFGRDLERPDKLERYMAEALVRQSLPVEALEGIATYDEATASPIKQDLEDIGMELPVVVRAGWFF